MNYPVNKKMIRRGRMNFLAADLSGHPQICRLLKADRCTDADVGVAVPPNEKYK